MSEIGMKGVNSYNPVQKQEEKKEVNQTAPKAQEPAKQSEVKGDQVNIIKPDASLNGKVPAADNKINFSSEETKPAEPKKERTVSERKGTLTVAWGYGVQGFTPSDIRFQGQGHDFTLRGIRAYDRPSPFSFDTYFNPAKLSIPQYMLDINYHVTDKVFIRAGQHHMKYVMDDNQMANITGHIDASADPAHAGTYNGEFIRVNDIVQKFEHTDGLNDVHIGVGMVQPVWFLQN